LIGEIPRKKINVIITGVLILLFCITFVNAALVGGNPYVNSQNSSDIPIITQSATPSDQEDTQHKLAAIEGIQHYKENETYWQRKISSDLLQVIDPLFPPSGMTQRQSKDMMQKMMQLIPANNVASELNISPELNQTFDDAVLVGITVKESWSSHIVDPFVTKIVSQDKQFPQYVVAWAELRNIETIAKLDGVMRVNLLDRGLYSYMNQPVSDSRSEKSENISQPVIPLTAHTAQLPSQIPSTPSSPTSTIVICVSLIISGMIFLKSYRT
jgi:hypothetical protein